PLNSNTTTATTAAYWDWKRHALTVPLEAFVMCVFLIPTLPFKGVAKGIYAKQHSIKKLSYTQDQDASCRYISALNSS
ncbi:hypothetical protein ACPFUQ_003603, partial [Vibrio cholerae]